jgi:tryptophanyl-tRNA synthetase
MHLGNYFGAVAQHIELAASAPRPEDALFFVANLHALTTTRDAALLARRTRAVAVDYLALGLDPENATLFRQSDLPEVCELLWFLACSTGKGLLERAHAYKDRVARGEEVNVGLFAYPLLMAADVLAYRATLVPVGRDQQQHVEMAQDMARSFNASFHRDVFVRPEWRFSDAPLVPGVDGHKMSKSRGNAIPVFPPEGMTDRQVYKAYFAGIVTDSRGVSEPKDADDTLMTLLRLLDPEDAEALAPAYERGGVGYGETKERLFAAYRKRFASAAERRRAVASDSARVDRVLAEGATRAGALLRETLSEARAACGVVA